MSVFERWRLSRNPYVTAPIDRENLDLFVGREKHVPVAYRVLSEKSILVIEGDRGVGTTSLGNYLRFTKESERNNLTPNLELSVGIGWNEELLLANVLSVITWELEGRTPSKYKAKYKEIRSAAHQIRETYRNISLQLTVLGTGGGIGTNAETMVTMPQLIPTATLIKHLIEIKDLIGASGYQKETVVQLNNLDIDTLFSPGQLSSFLNSIRDILQIDGYTWILVGDSGLRNFIADKVDRLDDIISYSCMIEPLSLEEVQSAIKARVQKYALKSSPIHPLSDDLIQVLYSSTNGRIRQIYGFATRLIHSIEDNLLIEQVTPDVALPIIKREVENRSRLYGVTKRERAVLEKITFSPGISPSRLTKDTGLSAPNVSRILSHLLKSRLVTVRQKGRSREYNAAPDVLIAFTKTE